MVVLVRGTFIYWVECEDFIILIRNLGSLMLKYFMEYVSIEIWNIEIYINLNFLTHQYNFLQSVSKSKINPKLETVPCAFETYPERNRYLGMVVIRYWLLVDCEINGSNYAWQ